MEQRRAKTRRERHETEKRRRDRSREDESEDDNIEEKTVPFCLLPSTAFLLSPFFLCLPSFQKRKKEEFCGQEIEQSFLSPTPAENQAYAIAPSEKLNERVHGEKSNKLKKH